MIARALVRLKQWGVIATGAWLAIAALLVVTTTTTHIVDASDNSRGVSATGRTPTEQDIALEQTAIASATAQALTTTPTVPTPTVPTPTPPTTATQTVLIPSPTTTPMALAPITTTTPTALVPAPTPTTPLLPPIPTDTILTIDQLNYYAAQAGWDVGSGDWANMRAIITTCEDPSLSTTAHNGTDPNGGSWGLAQLNASWFNAAGEDFASWADPTVNLRTAKWLYNRLGRFGGSGGWSCATTLGIY